MNLFWSIISYSAVMISGIALGYWSIVVYIHMNKPELEEEIFGKTYQFLDHFTLTKNLMRGTR